MDNPVNLPELNVVQLLSHHGIQPDKRLGQNFLIDPVHLMRVVEVGEITRQDTVLEVGAGLGSLTRYLAIQAKDVIAVEIDQDLIPILHEVSEPYKNTTIIQGDILELDLNELLPPEGYLVVANIPYYITSNLIRQLLSTQVRPKRLVLTVQLEVAKRICAKPGKLSMLGLSVQVFGQPEIIYRIPPGAFFPAPQVESAILRVNIYPTPIIPIGHLDEFFFLTRAGFSQKRKKLRNSLSAGLRRDKREIEDMLHGSGIDPGRRAETLSLDEWKSLTSQYISMAAGS